MKTKKKNLSPEESLSLISEMINNVKGEYKQNAFYFLFWGWLITLACITHFVGITFLVHNEWYDKIGLLSFINWSVYIIIGAVIQYWYRAKKPEKARSSYNRFFSILWQVAGLSMIVSAFISLNFNVYPTVIILVIVAMSTLITGIVVRFTPFILGGIIFFVAALVSTYFLYEYSLLVCAGAIILGYIIPGYLLKKSKSNQNV